MKQYKILIVRNRTTERIILDKYLDWFKVNTPVEMIREEMTADFDVTTEIVGNATYGGAICGPDIIPKLRTLIPEGKYNAVILYVGNKLDDIRISVCNGNHRQFPLYPDTELIQLRTINDGGKDLNHELFHGFFAKANKCQIPIVDPMDTYINDSNLIVNNVVDTNREMALSLLKPYWDLIINFRPKINSIMTPIYKPANFGIKELVSKSVYDKFGEQSWQFLDSRLLKNIQYIREKTGLSVLVNNYGKGLEFRGFDPKKDYGGYRENCSQHTMGRALDFNIANWTTLQTHAWIKANYLSFPEPCITLENPTDTASWTHMDVRYRDYNGTILFVGAE